MDAQRIIMAKRKLKENEFFDINKFPAKEGILVFPISMGKISNSQSAKECFKYVNHLISKIEKPFVGLNIIYGDYLYFNSDEKASKLKSKFLTLILSHKNNFINILKRNKMLIQKSFSFITWNQQILEIKEYTQLIGELNILYKKDRNFQKYIKEDFKLIKGKRKLDKNQINFFLEEILTFYLIQKGKAKLHNEYIQGHEKWILICYPGKPLKSEIYLFQKNFFKLNNPKNGYQNSFYDLQEKKLYNYDNINLETIKL